MTPGIQPQRVSRKTIVNEPQPLSATAKGGNKTANNTRKQDINVLIYYENNDYICALQYGHRPLRMSCSESGLPHAPFGQRMKSL